MKIDENIGANPYRLDNRNSTNSLNFKHFETLDQDSAITISTKDGDKVSISQSFASAFTVSASKNNINNSQMQTFTAGSIQSENFQFQVTGDLDEEELHDIKHLFKDIFKIAKNFFSGSLKKSFQGIDKLSKHMGSISEVNASFTYTQVVSSTYSSNFHPLADFQEKIPAAFDEHEELQKHNDNFIGLMLNAQWNQIEKMLDLHNHLLDEDISDTPIVNNLPQPKNPVPDRDIKNRSSISDNDLNKSEIINDLFKDNSKSTKHAERIMKQIAKTMEHHPRLSPFVVPLANHVINSAADQFENSPQKDIFANQIKSDFMRYFDKWFFS